MAETTEATTNSTAQNCAVEPFTNEHFVAYCLRMVGQPYWYGTTGNKATTNLLNRKAKQYPTHYASSRMSRYKQDIRDKKVVCDCIGGVKGYMWSGGGQAMLDAIGTDATVSNKYGSNGCPDKGANSMFSWAKSKGAEWGTIDTLPEILGLALYTDGHVGYYVGSGEAVEWRGFSYGCVKTKVAERKWKYWYKLPFIDYGAATVEGQTTTGITLGSRLLKKGSVGADVKVLQELLMQLGYSLSEYGADGSYGAETEAAVKAFQKKNNLVQDGKYGDLTHAALMEAVGDNDGESIEQGEEQTAEKQTDTEQPTEQSTEQSTAQSAQTVQTTQTVIIVSEGGKVNAREGNGTEYGRITAVTPGSTFPLIATATNGWNAIVVNKRVGWVSGEFSRVV